MTHVARTIALLFLLVVAAPVHAAPPPIPVTTCGQAIPAKTTGYLTGDHDCAGYTGGLFGAAVELGKNATFDLAGFTLTGGESGVACITPCGDAVCSGTCTLRNGTIAGSANSGVFGFKIKAEQLTVRDHGDRGIDGHKVKVLDSTIADNAEIGVVGQTVDVRSSSITGNGRAGVATSSAQAHGRARVKDSTVTGNDTSPECANPATGCLDIVSGLRPRVVRTTCGTSGPGRHDPPCKGWCVCEGDHSP